MKRVINGLLYDTESSLILHTEENTGRILYKTTKNNFFVFFPNGEIVPKTEESARDYLGKHNVEMYISLFGKPEEA